MGMLLITAATGLVVRQLTARKLGASESYQQMAETAASNGFNRIIAVLNNSDENNYRGFYSQRTINPTPATHQRIGCGKTLDLNLCQR